MRTPARAVSDPVAPIRRWLWIALALSLFVLQARAQTPAEPKPISVALQALGDSADGVVARVTFRFATPPEVAPGAFLVLQGSFMQDARVLRNFRFDVPPEKRGELSAIQAFAEGEADVEVRLIMPVEEGAPIILAKTSERFVLSKTNNPYVASEQDGAEAILAEGTVAQTVGAVKIRAPRRDVALNLFTVQVDVLPPVKRVEFWVEGKRVQARNSPPYAAELDLGNLPKRVEVRVVGYDANGRYVDADAFVVNERETQLEVKITRTIAEDGVSHFKLSIQNPRAAVLKSVAFFAGDQKIHEWSRPPYALSLPAASLRGQDFVRVSVIDEAGYEASDLMFLSGDRFIEEIEVHVVELPVSVAGPNGAPVTNLTEQSFTILENGKPKKLASFNFATNLPLSLGVLLDQSGSMKERMEEAKSAASEFFRSVIRNGDRAFIGAFASDPSRNAPFVSNVATLEAQLAAIGDAAGFTSLHDAIVTGLYRFRNLPGRKALIVITDGADTSSRLSYDDMLHYARASRVPIYFIGIGIGFADIAARGMMKSAAAETGAVAYFIRDAKQLGETYKQLEMELRSQYLLTYHTEGSKKDTSYRTIEVKVDRADARVRTIRGFIP